MLQPITVRTVKSYQQDDQSDCVNVVQIEDEISATFELLKVLHQYNSLNAWTLLIAPDHVPSKALLDSCSIDTSKLLVIRQKHLVNIEYVLSSALHNGNFAAVITWTDIINNRIRSNRAGWFHFFLSFGVDCFMVFQPAKWVMPIVLLGILSLVDDPSSISVGIHLFFRPNWKLVCIRIKNI
jgi:cell division inhibitor SulA